MQSTCHVCEKGFEARFRYQVREENGWQYIYICSTACQQKLLLGEDGVHACDTCGYLRDRVPVPNERERRPSPVLLLDRLPQAR